MILKPDSDYGSFAFTEPVLIESETLRLRMTTKRNQVFIHTGRLRSSPEWNQFLPAGLRQVSACADTYCDVNR